MKIVSVYLKKDGKIFQKQSMFSILFLILK